MLRISSRSLMAVVVLTVGLSQGRLLARAQTLAQGYGFFAGEAFSLPAVKPALSTNSGSSRSTPGGLLWEDRYDASFGEQAFSVATLKDLTFAAGYVLNGPGRDFVVRAYEAASGTLVWQDQVNNGSDEFASGVATDETHVFVSGTAHRPTTDYDWMLRAYDAATGSLLWENLFDLAGREDFSRGTALAAGGGLVFLGGFGTNIHDVGDGNTDYVVRAHDAATGVLVWQDRVEGFSGAYSIALENDRLFVGGWNDLPAFDQAVVRAYDARSGALLWEHLTRGVSGTGQTWTKAIRAQDGRVFVVQPLRATSAPFALTPLIQAFDAQTGSRLWTRQFDTDAEGGWLNELDVFGGQVFVVGRGGPRCGGTQSNCDAIVRSYDAAAGTLQWERQLDLSGTHDTADLVTASRGTVFVLSQADATFSLPGCCFVGRWVLQAFETSSGQLLWQSLGGELDFGVYNMTVARARLFIPGRSMDRLTGASDFIVRAYDVRGRSSEIEPLVAAPRQLTLTGTSGEISYEVTFDGTLTTAPHGLIPPETQPGNVVDDPLNDINSALASGVGVTIHTVSVPPGTRHLRIALFDEDTDGADDLDLYLFDAAGNFLEASGSATSAEVVDIPAPPAGDYFAVVHGWETDGPDANYTLFEWVLGGGPEGNFTVSGPNPSTGPSGSVTVTWFGLVPGLSYLGAVSYLNGTTEIDQTLITVRR